MPWFKVDDNLAFHAKAVAAGNAAMGLWVRAGAWSSQQLTDGFVPDHVVTALGTTTQAQKLVAVGLWIKENGGFSFHQWNERQPSSDSIKSKRAEARDRMNRLRQAGGSQPVRANKERSSQDVRSTPTRPDPTRSSSDVEKDVDVDVPREPERLGEVVNVDWGKPRHGGWTA